MAKKKKSMHRGKFWIVAIIIFILLFSVIGVAIIYIAPNGGNTTQPAFEEVTPQQEVIPEPSVEIGTGNSASITGSAADSNTGQVEGGSDQANEEAPLAEGETEGAGEVGIQEVDVSAGGEGDIEINMIE